MPQRIGKCSTFLVWNGKLSAKVRSMDTIHSDGEKLISVFIEDEMRKSYLDYSMSMITARALPDVRDGLKPVHRRVLIGLSDIGLLHNKPTKNIIRTETARFMIPSFEWPRTSRLDIRWFPARVISVR